MIQPASSGPPAPRTPAAGSTTPSCTGASAAAGPATCRSATASGLFTAWCWASTCRWAGAWVGGLGGWQHVWKREAPPSANLFTLLPHSTCPHPRPAPPRLVPPPPGGAHAVPVGDQAQGPAGGVCAPRGHHHPHRILLLPQVRLGMGLRYRGGGAGARSTARYQLHKLGRQTLGRDSLRAFGTSPHEAPLQSRWTVQAVAATSGGTALSA